MKRLSKKQICIAILSIFLIGHHPNAKATNFIWNAVDNTFSDDYSTAANWIPNVGGPPNSNNDYFLFDGRTVLYNPIYSQGNTNLTIGGIQYLQAPNPYVFTIDAQNFGTGNFIISPNNSPYGGVDNSQLGSLATMQQINIIQGGVLQFGETILSTQISASADVRSSGLITYNVDSDDDQSAILFLNSSTAGAATINLGALSTGSATTTFNQTSTAATSHINLYNDATLTFQNSSTPADSTITANNGNISFGTTITNSTAEVCIENGSSVLVQNSITLDKLNSASSTDVITINPGQRLTVGDCTTCNVIEGQLTGSGVFAKQGCGTVELTNTSNNYSAGTVVTDGTLIVTTDTLPAGGDVAAMKPSVINFVNDTNTLNNTFTGDFDNTDGTILYTGSVPATLSGQIDAQPRVVVDAPPSGSLTLPNAGNNIGSAEVCGGTLFIPLATSPDTTVGSCGVLDWTSGGTGANDVVNCGKVVYSGTNAGVMIGAISGGGALIVDAPGAGTLTLTGLNTYTGPTTVEDGTLIVDVNALPFEGEKKVEPGATLQFQYSSDGTFAGDITNDGTVRTAGANDVTLLGDITGTGSVVSGATGANLTLRGNNSYEGGTTVNGNCFLTAHTQSIPTSGSRTIANNGILFIDNNLPDCYPGTFVNNGSIIVSATADVGLTGEISGTGEVQIDSPGNTVTMTATNTYLGGTSLKTGSTLLTTTQSLPVNRAINTGGGILQLNNCAFGILTGTITSPGNGTIKYTGAADAEINAAISGDNDILMDAKDSTLSLTGNNSFSGDVDIISGTLRIAGAQSLPSGSDVTIDPCGILKVDLAIADTISNRIVNNGRIVYTGTSTETFNGNISGTGVFEVNAPLGRVILQGAGMSYSGGTVITNGTLQANPSLLPIAAVNPSVTVCNTGVLQFATSSDTYVGSIALCGEGSSLDTDLITNTLTLSGPITGCGAVHVTNGNLVLTSCENTYEGGTTVAAGRTLTGNSCSLQGNILNDGTVNFVQPTTGDFCGSFSSSSPGSGTINKTGTGELRFCKDSGGFQGTTNINQGTFDLQALLGGNLIITNSKLQGNGTVLGFLQLNNSAMGEGSFHVGGSVGISNFSHFDGCLDSDSGVIIDTFSSFNGCLSADDLIQVSNSSSISGTVTSNSNIAIDNLSSASGCFTAASSAVIQNESSMNGCLTAGSAVFIQNSSVMNGCLTGGEDLVVTNNSAKTGSSHVQGNVIITGGSSYWGDSCIQGDLSVTDNSQFSTGKLLGDCVANCCESCECCNGNCAESHRNTVITNILNVVVDNGKHHKEKECKDNCDLRRIFNEKQCKCIGVGFVGGDYTQDATSTFNWHVDGDGNSDVLFVNGDASLNGTFNIISLDGILAEDVAYLALHVEGELSGTFSTVKTNYGRFLPELLYVDNYGSHDVLVKFTNIFKSFTETYNQCQIGKQLACITNPSPELEIIIDEIVDLASSPDTLDQARLAYDQLSGMQYLSMVAANQLAGHKFLRQLYDPIRSIVTLTEPHKKLYADPCCETEVYECLPRFSGWLEGSGGHTTIDGNKNAKGAKFDSYSITGGFQARVGDEWTFGLAGSYEHDNIDYNIGGHGTNRTGFVAGYGLYRACNWYFFGDLAFGWSNNSLRRPIHIGDLFYSAKSSPKVDQGLAYIEAGFDIPVCQFLIQPFFGLEGGYLSRGKVTETGAYPLNLVVYEKDRSNIYSRLGVHLSTDTMCKKYALSVDLAWQCRLNNTSSRIHERFQSFSCCDERFQIKGVNFTRNSFDGAATFSAFLCDRWELFVEVAGEKWSRASSYDVTGGVKFSW